MNHIEAMKRALDAIDSAHADMRDEIAALRQAIEQAEKIENPPIRIQNHTHTDHPMRHWDKTCPACLAEKQEPVAYLYHDTACAELANPLADSTLLVLACDRKPNGRNETPLYTAPPRKEWVGLTNYELSHIKDMENGFWITAKAIEAKLKERNNG